MHRPLLLPLPLLLLLPWGGAGGQDVSQVCSLCTCQHLQSAHLSELVCTADHAVLEVDCASKPKVKQNPNQFQLSPTAKNASSVVWLSYRRGGLTSFPSLDQFTLFNVTSFSLDHNRLVYIPPRALSGLRNLSIFSASHNDINSVAVDAFKGLRNLRYIDLSHNSMHTLDFRLVLDSEKLVSLDMHNNGIKNIIPPPLGVKINTLEILDVSVNKLPDFPLMFFSSFPNLLRLNISYNGLGVLTADLFHDLAALKVLDASGNRLKDVDTKVVDHLQSLTNLHLSDNELIDVTFVEAVPSLVLLAVRNNSFNTLGDKSLSGGLQRLVVSHNNLTELSHIFKVFNQLKSLDASWNPCAEFPDHVRAGLRELILDGTLISSWPAQRPGGGTIDHLSLSHTPIAALGPHSFSGILKPKNASGTCVSLEISNTSLSSVDEDALRDIDICKLDLSHNRLRWLPESLIEWGSTTLSADLQHNPWHCDCALQWMLTDAVPAAYRADQALLNDLRCASPSELAGVRLVHWYRHAEAALCGSKQDAMLTAKPRPRMLSQDTTDKLLVTVSSSPLMIAVLLCLSVLAAMMVILAFALQRRAIRQRRMRRNRRF